MMVDKETHCYKCVYGSEYSYKSESLFMCNYSSIEGHLRTVSNGKIILPPGKCDKFKEGESIKLKKR